MSMYNWLAVNKKDLKKDLRYNYKHKALNAFGKKISELTCIEQKKVLEWTLNDILNIGYKNYGKDFTEFFKKTFEKELNQCLTKR